MSARFRLLHVVIANFCNICVDETQAVTVLQGLHLQQIVPRENMAYPPDFEHLTTALFVMEACFVTRMG